MKNVEFKPLGKVMNLVEAVALKVSYTYDDLVFVEQNPFLLRFDLKKAYQLYLHFNTNCEPNAATNLEKSLNTAAMDEGLKILISTKYRLSAKEGSEEVEIHFES